ncbi:MAG: hypothetical protein ACSHYB_16240 [Roseibacillus sp.]
MMEGYLSTRTLDPNITVQFTIPSLASLGWDEYDIYVYSNAGTASLPTSNISLSPGGGGIPITFSHSDLVPGYGAGTSSYVDSQSFPSGNYVVYSGRLETTQFIQIEASTGSAPGEAYLNGIEIVGRTIPEPSSALLALLGMVPLLQRRRKA